MAAPIYSRASDGFRRTEFFGAEVYPTIPGNYECSTGSGFVFTRRWDGQNWISSVNGTVSNVRMLWRGVEPGSVGPKDYPRELRTALEADVALRLASSADKFIGYDLSDTNVAALAA